MQRAPESRSSLYFFAMPTITWDQFTAVEIRVGTVIHVETFPEARKPAYRITVDFGGEVGVRRTSAQVTTIYSPDELIGRQVVGVVNFPPKQIGPMMSEFLLTGFHREDGAVVLAVPERDVPNGARLA
jgi:tRNA-binding protein